MTYPVVCHTVYVEFLYGGDRPAQQVWPSQLLGAFERCADAVAATLSHGSDDLIITRVTCAGGELRGYLPGGLAA